MIYTFPFMHAVFILFVYMLCRHEFVLSDKVRVHSEGVHQELGISLIRSIGRDTQDIVR